MCVGDIVQRQEGTDVHNARFHHQRGVRRQKRLGQGARRHGDADAQNHVLIIVNLPGHRNGQQFIERIRLTHKLFLCLSIIFPVPEG